MLNMILLLAVSSTPTQGYKCQVPILLEGKYTIGFEASYLDVSAGKLGGKRVWIEDANTLDKLFVKKPSAPESIWRRADVRLRGCLNKKRSGHMGMYSYTMSSISIDRFRQL